MTKAARIDTQIEGTESVPAEPEGIAQWLPFALLMLDADDRVIFANPAAERFFCQSSLFLGRRTLLDIAGPALPALVRAARDRGAATLERDLIFEDHQGSGSGSTFAADVEIVPHEDSPGALLVVISGVAHEPQFAGLPPSISAMAAVLAHEVKNPLSGIRGAAQLIAQNAGEDDQRLTSLICDEAERIRALVDRLEAFGDPRPAELSPVNIHEVLDHVMGLAAAGFARDITFERIYDPSLPLVQGERDRLVQILLNLVKNAAEAAPKTNGRIELTTRFRYGAKVSPAANDQFAGDMPVAVETPLEISITDNGPGIDPVVRAHLFDPFVTTKTGGTGLGLAMVQKYAADLDARIDCDSSDKGTCFRLLLPAWKGEAP